jgi:two-component system sensor histidine kinase PilS (NtrC family)
VGLVALHTVPVVRISSFAAALVIIAASSGVLLLIPAVDERAHRLTRLVLGLDVANVTLIVTATGGPQSVFAFMYVLVVIGAAILLGRQSALSVAGAASLLYAGVVLGNTVFPLSDILEPMNESTGLEVLSMFLNTATFLVVGILAGGLSERYRSAQHELSDRRKDLSDLQAFKDLVFQSIGTGLIALDPEHRITAFNRAAADITGVEAAEALGRPWEVIFGLDIHLDDVAAAVGGSPRAFRRFERTLRPPDRGEVPVALTFWPLRSGSGETVGLIAVCEDLSALKDMEVRIRQADRLATVGRMAANIAHEIRNPLACLTGAIDVLTKDLPVEPNRERLMQIVTCESERLNRFIKEFLDYARPTPPSRQPLRLGAALDDLLLLFEHGSLPEGVKIVREYDGPLEIHADPQQLRQLFWNLCLNAVEAMPGGGELRVGARMLPGRAEVWISDTGRGISAADLPHVFEPFFSTKPQGTGIGLAVAHRIVHEHGGDIEVRSAPGLGTTFVTTLPSHA